MANIMDVKNGEVLEKSGESDIILVRETYKLSGIIR